MNLIEKTMYSSLYWLGAMPKNEKATVFLKAKRREERKKNKGIYLAIHVRELSHK